MLEKPIIVAGHEDVRIFNSHVEKKYADHFELEVEKSSKLYEVSINNGFISPEVLSYNTEKHRINFELIRDFIPIKEIYINQLLKQEAVIEHPHVFFKSGATLASIHADMKLETKSDWKARNKTNAKSHKLFGKAVSELLRTTPMAFHHCDFGFSNVHYSTTEKKIVVIDPSPNLYSSIAVNDFGSIYVDIGVFISNLSGRISPKYYLKSDWSKVFSIKNSFYEGYEKRAGFKLDRGLAEKIGYLLSYSNYARYNAIRREVAMLLQYNFLKKNQVSKQ